MWIYADQAWLSLQAFKIGRIALVVNLGNTSNRGSIGGGGGKGGHAQEFSSLGQRCQTRSIHQSLPTFTNAGRC